MSLSDRRLGTKGYAICTIGRTGATWFGDLLTGTGVLGRPDEFFNTPLQRARLGQDYPRDRIEQIDLVLSEGATPNGIYGFKVFPSHLRQALDEVRWSSLPNLRFVHWTRRDVLGQALSRYRASHTLKWRSFDEEERPPPSFDGDAILNGMRWAIVQNARWELFFGRTGLTPLRLVYEEVMRDPQAAIDSIAELLALDSSPQLGTTGSRLTVQRDALTETWRARFIDEFGDVDTMDLLDADQVERPHTAASSRRS